MKVPSALVNIEDRIMTVTLNRPDKLNAINPEVASTLESATKRFGDDEQIRAMIITGNGRYFSAGYDVSSEANEERETARGIVNTRVAARRNFRREIHVLHDELENIEKPIVLAAQGPCLGLGLEMACSCDFRFCTPTTHFGLPEIRLGWVAASGGTSRLTRLIGPHWSKWIGMAGRNIDAETALRIGLVHDIFPAEEFMANVREFTLGLVDLPAEAMGIAKLTIDLMCEQDRDRARHIERIGHYALMDDPISRSSTFER
jgi:enoyl-CoA hydratase